MSQSQEHPGLILLALDHQRTRQKSERKSNAQRGMGMLAQQLISGLRAGDCLILEPLTMFLDPRQPCSNFLSFVLGKVGACDLRVLIGALDKREEIRTRLARI